MPYVAGNDIAARCPTCLGDREHTVMEAHSGIVFQVRCKTCGEVHPYGRPKVAPRPKAEPRAPSAKKKGKRASAESRPKGWAELVRGREAADATPYSPSETFALDQLIHHAAFGLGVVTAVLEGGKLEALFEAGFKKLVHARG